jgi:tRNA (mo5U34)-methyltransferase
MDLNGEITPGRNNPAEHLPKLHLPERMDGQQVLDIGAWDGFYSFECERRGAAHVIATDSFVWRQPHIGRHGFDYAHKALRSTVRAVEVDVLDLNNRTLGRFDTVLMLGVLYHMRHPLLALEKAFAMVAPGGLLVLETHLDMINVDGPALAFYEGRELCDDETNWFGPNPPAVLAMCRAAGFKEVTIVHHDIRLVVHARRLE